MNLLILNLEISEKVGGRWQVLGVRWQVAGGRWQVAGGRWQVLGGVVVLVRLNFY